jgi:hypothetical protein
VTRKHLWICSLIAKDAAEDADAAARRARGSALTEMQLGGAGEAGEAAGAALQALTCYNRPARVAYLRELVQALLDGKAQARAPAPGNPNTLRWLGPAFPRGARLLRQSAGPRACAAS